MKNAIPIIETQRLVMRPLRISDARQIQALFPHWEIVQFLAAAIPWPYPEDGAEQFLDRTLPENEAGRQYDWAITLKVNYDDLLIGSIGLYPANPEDNRGFWLAEAYHRQGFMKEAASAVNDFAFYKLGMPYLVLNNAEPNRGSHRLKEISGAKIIATIEDVPFVAGRFRSIRWRLAREDWESHRPQWLGDRT